MSESYENLIVHADETGVATCTFNRPEKRNALNKAVVDEIHHLLNRWRSEDRVQVVIFTGSGDKAFVSGADIAELKERTNEDAFKQINSGLFAEIERFPKPTIAAINGFALGGGLELALACDLRVCSETAKLGLPEVGLGIIPAAGGCFRLQRVVGLGRAKELIFTAKIIDAKRALEIGLVNRVATQEKLLQESKELALEITKQSSLAVKLAKAALNTNHDAGFAQSMFETAAQAVLFEDEEKHRRMQAFLERKKS